MANQIGDITARLTLETIQFDSKMKASVEGSTAGSRAMAKAAKQAGADQAFAAKFAGDAVTAESLRIVAADKGVMESRQALRQSQAIIKAGYLDEATSTNVAAAALQRYTLAQKEADAARGRTGHGVSDRMAASSAVRGLETGNVGIRSVENFITTIPGSSKILQGLFSVIGPVAFAAAVVEGGMKLYEFGKAGQEAAKNTRVAFEEINDATRKTGAELDIANDKLANSIAKLEHKPENLLKLALDEDRKAAYDLALEVDTASKKVTELLANNGIGFGRQLGLLALGQNVSQTTGSEKVIKSAFTDVRNASRQNVASEESLTPGAQADAVKMQNRTKMVDAYGEAIKKVDAELKNVYKTQSQDTDKTDFSNRTEMLEDSLDQLKAERHNIQAGYQHSDLEVQNNRDEEAKRNAEGAKSALEALRKADEMRYKGMEADLAQEKLLHSMSLKEDYDFWDARRSAFSVGSQQYNSIVEKQAQLAMESAQKTHAEIKKFQDEQKAQAKEDATQLPAMLARNSEDMRRGAVKEGGERNQDYIDSNQLALQSAQNSAREREAKLNDEAGRSITRRDAAVQLAAVHTAEYVTVLESLNGILGTRQMQYALDPSKQNAKAVADAQGQVMDAQSKRSIQMQGDSEAIYGRQTSAIVGASDALEEFAKASRDSAAVMRDLVENSLSSINDEILKASTTRDHDVGREFSNVGAGIFRSIAGAGLKSSEGSILSSLGLGGSKKPTGAAGDPTHTIIDNAQSIAGLTNGGMTSANKVVSGGFKGLLGKLFGNKGNSGSGSDSDSDSSDSDSSNPFASFGSIAFPAFAGGTENFRGGLALVGESGPEVAYLPAGSGVVPNHRLMSSRGGDVHHHYVDARGATDPAQVSAAVDRSMARWAPKVVSASVSSMKEQNRRVPSMRRS